MAVWSIKIVPGKKPGAPATFVPQLQQPKPGSNPYPDGLYADPGDAVSWDNTSGREPYHPWPADQNYKPLQIPPAGILSNEIPAGESSRPAYVVVTPPINNTTYTTYTIYYICKLHPGMHGKITATIQPQ
jgi:plastocyanin